MSWLFSQALVAEYSEASSLGGTPFAPSNTTPTPQAFLSRDKTTDAWSRFPSGMTCEPLTDDRGEGLLKLFLEGFLALTSVPPSKTRKASRGSKADCGLRWPALLAKWDRDTSSWKTAQCLLLAGLDEFSETWPKWGMMRDGECWELAMPALRTTESASGSWVTPNARDWKDSPNMATVRKDGKNKVDQTPRQVFQFWRSPQARDWKNASTIAERGGAHLERARPSAGTLWGPWGTAVAETGDDGSIRFIQPGICGVANGVANRVDRLKAVGNGQVGCVAALAWRLLGGPR